MRIFEAYFYNGEETVFFADDIGDAWEKHPDAVEIIEIIVT